MRLRERVRGEREDLKRGNGGGFMAVEEKRKEKKRKRKEL